MQTSPGLRRLVELPGIAELERKALMNPRYAEPDARSQYAEIDACSLANFGLTADAALEVAKPADWDGVERRPGREQAQALEAAGWDVTDDRRRVLRMYDHFSLQLWLAIRGVAGQLPFVPDDDKPDSWGLSMASEAAKFKRNRR